MDEQTTQRMYHDAKMLILQETVKAAARRAVLDGLDSGEIVAVLSSISMWIAGISPEEADRVLVTLAEGSDDADTQH
jgi:hypothetical protein